VLPQNSRVRIKSDGQEIVVVIVPWQRINNDGSGAFGTEF